MNTPRSLVCRWRYYRVSSYYRQVARTQRFGYGIVPTAPAHGLATAAQALQQHRAADWLKSAYRITGIDTKPGGAQQKASPR
jgi:hypothetical protein